MSLLKLSKIQDSEWYIPLNIYPHGEKGYKTKKFRRFMGKEATLMKWISKEIAFYTTELPIVQHHKYDMWKYFDKQYIYKQIIDIVVQKNPRNMFQRNSMHRTVGLV